MNGAEIKGDKVTLDLETKKGDKETLDADVVLVCAGSFRFCVGVICFLFRFGVHLMAFFN